MQKYAFGCRHCGKRHGPVAACSAINDWNLIVKNKLTSSSEVEGRTMVGQISGTSNYATKLLPTSAYLHRTRYYRQRGGSGSNNYQVNSGRAGSLGRRARRRGQHERQGPRSRTTAASARRSTTHGPM